MEQKDWNKKEKRIRKDERRKVNKKRRAKGTLATLGAFIIALLLSIGSGFLGLNPVGIFEDGSGSHSVIKENETKSADTPETGDEAGDAKIVVKGEEYIYNGQSFDLEGIKVLVGGLEKTSRIDLVDELAQNLAFEEVEKVLNDAQIEYNIVENYE